MRNLTIVLVITALVFAAPIASAQGDTAPGTPKRPPSSNSRAASRPGRA